MHKHKIAVVGCGNVGAGLLEILHNKKESIKERYDFEYEVTLVNDIMKGTAMNPNGLDLGAILAQLKENNTIPTTENNPEGFEELLKASEADLMLEATPTNLHTGGMGLHNIRTALSLGISVTTTNKGPIVVAYDELMGIAKKTGAKFRYEGIVMSGTPLINLITECLAGCDIMKIEGILNGTTNYMLTEMGKGCSYDDALKKAQALGYAEADPTGDVEGWDPAGKVAILARVVYGVDIPIDSVDRTGISQITPEDIAKAKEEGMVIKLISGIQKTDDGIVAYVKPKKIPMSNPLSNINGATNAATIYSDLLGETTIIGAGAGRKETAIGLLSDLLAMIRYEKEARKPRA